MVRASRRGRWIADVVDLVTKTHPGSGRAGVTAVMQERGTVSEQGRQRLGFLDAVQRTVAYLTRLLPIVDLLSMDLQPGSSKTCNCIAFNESSKAHLVANGASEEIPRLHEERQKTLDFNVS